MRLSLSLSDDLTASGDARRAGEADDRMRRRFVEAARRAEIVSHLNSARSEGDLGRFFVEGLCHTFKAEIAFMSELPSGGREGRAIACVGAPPASAVEMVQDLPEVVALEHGRGAILGTNDPLGVGAAAAMLAPCLGRDGRFVVVGLARLYDDAFDAADLALLEAVTASAGQALERIWADVERDRQASQQAALVRAAISMASSLDVDETIATLCEEAASAFDSPMVAAAMGDEVDGYEIRGHSGTGDSLIGFRQAAGTGLGGQAVLTGRPISTHVYQEEGYAPPESPQLAALQTCMAAPLRWEGRIRGFVSVGYTERRLISSDELGLLEGFVELAGLACANAERHGVLREEAAFDGLTGCINRDEFARCLAAQLETPVTEGRPLSLVLLDLDGFKAINDLYGHPVGDSVLRDVGAALLGAVRGDDVVARYGGDEFALILPLADEGSAGPILDRVRTAIQGLEVPGGRLTACLGMATRTSTDSPQDLIQRADDALREAKSSKGAGVLRRARPATIALAPEDGLSRRAGDYNRDRDRRALGGDIGLAIARQGDASSAARVATEELAQALAVSCCAVLQLEAGGRLSSLSTFGSAPFPLGWAEPWRGSVEAALREKRTVLLGSGAAPESRERNSELVAPISIEGRAWGVVACLAADESDGFDQFDSKLVTTVAEHLSSAVRAADLYEQLSRSMVGTAEALAAALEAKDSYTADHARSIAEIAVDVGMELGLSESASEDLRYGAIFHDVGKIAIPDSLLNKPGPLTEAEFEVIKQHPDAGAEILAPVPFLSGVRSIVRHAHEHWDGSGYPDHLRGGEIPLGSRIVLAVDAWHAMTSNRPYRAAMSEADALAELARCRGTQFDPAVADALLLVLLRRGVTGGL